MTVGYRILVALDLAARTEGLLAEVERQARAHNGTITLLHVGDPDPKFVGYIKAENPDSQLQTDVTRETKAGALRSEHQETQAVGDGLRAKGLRVANALSVQGSVIDSIIEQALKLSADLIIIGSRQHGAMYRLFYTSTTAQAVTQAPCPILVVPI